MSDRIEDLPRDLRTLCGGTLKDADGTESILVFPADSYANICSVREGLEKDLVDPCTRSEDIKSLQSDLEDVKREQADMEQRILNHFDTPRPSSNHNNKDFQCPEVDTDAKKKLKKAIADTKAGRYDHRKKSKTLKAVITAFDFSQKNGRMPSHDELKKLGYNDQQATDAGKWLEMQADPNPDEDSLFLPLHRPKRGRPLKK